MTIKSHIIVEADGMDDLLSDLSRFAEKSILEEAQVYLVGLGVYREEKIKAIQEVRNAIGLGLKESKAIVDSVVLGADVRLRAG